MTTYEESEVFEIDDFTTASEWERFVARIEEVLHEWGLTSQHQHHPQYHQSTPQQQQYKPHFSKHTTKGNEQYWVERVSTMKYADYFFTITHHKLTQLPHKKGDKRDDKDAESDGKEDRSGEMGRGQDGLKGGVEGSQGDGDDNDAGASNDINDFKMPTAWTEMMDNKDLFPARAHCLHRWCGLNDLMVVSAMTGGEDVSSESRVNMLLSSVTLAAFNTGCQTPMFVQAGQKWRRLFYGVLEVPGFRTWFEMVQLKKSLERHKYLCGLLHVFKEKIACSVAKKAIATIDVNFTYVISDWMDFPWMTPPPDIEDMNDGMGAGTFKQLPFGCYDDPLGEFFLSTTWNNLSEEMVVETDSYSDLDPMQAPHWSVRVRMNEDSDTIMGSYLKGFLEVCRKQDSPFSLISKNINNEFNPSIALDRLTEPVVPTIGHVMKKATSRLAVNQPSDVIPKQLLDAILLYLFPDALQGAAKADDDDDGGHDDDSGKNSNNNNNNNKGDSSDNSGGGNGNNVNNNNNSRRYDEEEAKTTDKTYYPFDFEQLKAAELDSLSSKMAVCLCYVNHSRGGVKAMTQLWEEFVLEMRFRWENNIKIPGMKPGAPNMGACLLHQKLQMLNCCIERKQARESANQTTLSKASTNHDLSSEDEEFFECHESSENGEPEGRLRLLDSDIKLLRFPKRYLYVPITQEPAPMTEDLLEEHAEVLSRLGTTQESSQLRARMQSTCLLSDMEAFKAANPGAVLGDFVRWYSPRDWVEKEPGKGELSQRMRLEGNMWMETWQNARCVPVARQRRLFDDTKEAEKVLHWLASMKLHQVAYHMLPLLLQYGVRKVVECEECSLSFLRAPMSKLKQQMVEATRSDCGGGGVPLEGLKTYEEAVQMLNYLEVGVSKARSLIGKLKQVNNQSEDDATLSTNHASDDRPIKHENEIDDFVSSLFEFPEFFISSSDSFSSPSSSPLGRLVFNFFLYSPKSEKNSVNQSADKKKDRPITTHHSNVTKLPKPIGKEYVFRLVCNRPAPWSRPCPQRMYCVITNDEFRLAGAFTNDTIFF